MADRKKSVIVVIWQSFICVFVGLQFVLGIIITLIWTTTAKVLTKIQYGRKVHGIMDNKDSIWYSSPNMCDKGIVNILMEVESDKYDENNCDHTLYEDIRHSLAEFIRGNSETLARKLVMLKLVKYGCCFWQKQDNFQIQDYLHKLDLPGDGLDEEQTQILFSKLSSCDLPYDNTATWEMLVCDKAVKKNRDDGLKTFYVLLKIHHAVGDIMTISKMLHRSILKVDFSKEKPISTEKVNLTAGKRLEITRDFFYEYNAAKFSRMRRHPLHPNSLDGDKHLVWITNTSDLLAKIKQIKKKKPGFVFADILFTATSIAFSKYFKKYDPSGRTHPKTVNILYARKVHNHNFQYSVANSSPSEDNDTVVVSNRVKIVKDDTPYNTVIEEACKYIQHDNIPEKCQLTHRMFSMLDYPLTMIKEMIVQAKNCTAIFSNLPGFPQADFCGDRKLKQFVFFPNHYTPLGISVALFTYNNELKIGMNVDVAVIETREQTKELLLSFIEEINNIHKALCIEYYA